MRATTVSAPSIRWPCRWWPYLVLVFGRQAHFGRPLGRRRGRFSILGFVGTGAVRGQSVWIRRRRLPALPASAHRSGRRPARGQLPVRGAERRADPAGGPGLELFPPMPGGAPLVAMLVLSEPHRPVCRSTAWRCGRRCSGRGAGTTTRPWATTFRSPATWS